MPTPPKRKTDDYEEETPRRRRPSRDDEETTPRRRRREPEEDDEEETPRTRRGAARRGSDDDDEPAPRSKRRGSRSEDDDADEESATGLGWDAVAKRKVYEDTHGGGFDDKKKPVYMRMANSFFLKEDEEAIIQFLTDMPMCADGYLLRRPGSEMRDFYVSQKPGKKYCLYADAGYKPTWRACFKLLDFRKYNKDKKRNIESDEPTEKYWLVPYALAEQIQAFANKKGRDLTEMTIRVSRTGSSQKTRYNFEIALDDRDRPIKVIEWEEELPTVKDALKALPEEEIERVINAERNADRGAETRGGSRNKGRGRSRKKDDDDADDDYNEDESPL